MKLIKYINQLSTKYLRFTKSACKLCIYKLWKTIVIIENNLDKHMLNWKYDFNIIKHDVELYIGTRKKTT